MTISDNKPVLAVDLDGTLIHSDIFVESILALLRKNLLYAFLMPLWLLGGRAALKHKIAQRVTLDPAALPYHAKVVEYVRQQRSEGRRTVLATGSNESLVQPVADYLGCFDEVLASDGNHNRTGSTKAQFLTESYGERGYDYIGNATVDIPVWKAARRVLVASRSKRFTRAMQKRFEVTEIFSAPAAGIKTWLRQLRVHQWLKNLLLFVPMLVGHVYMQSGVLMACILGFMAFCACASSVYIFNDLMDLPFDRQHERKRYRPLASGDLSIIVGFVTAPALFVLALFLAWQLHAQFTAVLLLYFVITTAYSAFLKRVAIVDVVVLAALYTLRIISGGVAVGVVLSYWLLGFSMFMFLGLALMKRYTEVRELERGAEVARGRGYRSGDSALLVVLGVSSSFCAVLVLALYINSPAVQQYYVGLYWLWLICPVLLFWLSHMWLAAHRARMHDDPIVFAVRDRVSLVAALVIGLLFVLAV